MQVKDLIDWLKDKPLNSEVVKADKNEPWSFIEIGLIHKDKIRCDSFQGELFDE